ncbi:MAG: pyruvate kinase [Lysobacterales bacterium]
MRRTSIVATLGPASSDPETLAALIDAGVNVTRLNYSHGTHEEHRQRLENVHEVARKLGMAVACLQDLSGPKIRTGRIAGTDGVMLEAGARFLLTADAVEGNAERVSTSYQNLPVDVKIGESILLDDGLIEIEVESVEGNDVITRVINGGRLKSNKGINLPGTTLSVSALTEKDKSDALHGIEIGVDFMALSFVRTAADVMELKTFLADHGRADMPVIAKIEKPEAIQNLESILAVADGVMVARGDLGVELPAEQVPMYQKKIIFEAYRRGLVVITATQMLESMIHNPRPTRAEASDVANAILDGSDAVMLSAETAVGEHAVETVATMARIATHTESKNAKLPWRWPAGMSLLDRHSTSRAVVKAACQAADELDARYLITFTESGSTARLVSHFRPNCPILAFTPSIEVYRQLALPWGITPILSIHYESLEKMLDDGLGILRHLGIVEKGDLAVVIFGTTLMPGATNIMKVHEF